MAEAARTHDISQGFGTFNFFPGPYPKCEFFLPSEYPPRGMGERGRDVNFPFMRLPLDIRREIYRYFVDPLLGSGEDHLDAPQLRNGVRFRQVESDWNLNPRAPNRSLKYGSFDPPPRQQHNANMDAPTHNGQQIGNPYADHLINVYRMAQLTVDAEDKEELEKGILYLEELRLRPPRCLTVINTDAPHPQCCVHTFHPPGRKDTPPHCFCSELTTYPLEMVIRCRHRDTCFKSCSSVLAKWKDLDYLDSLARVDPQITRELGEVLWENASVELECPELLADFVAERPAAVPLLRGILLNLELNGDPAQDTRTEALAEMLDFVSTHCSILSFGVMMWSSYEALLFPGTSPRAKLVEWAPLFRSLRTSTFVVRFIMKRRPWFSWHADDQGLNEAHARITAQIWHQWRPDCMQRESGETPEDEA
ncbi:hypothetical protein MFIFM68171_04947 [Madurella fahalii]|uniref:Uncharacterized protein n=1 Tax=Madurella fahalii TaxID=1157608 RepID=A0ABQ0GAE9_9PEZI